MLLGEGRKRDVGGGRYLAGVLGLADLGGMRGRERIKLFLIFYTSAGGDLTRRQRERERERGRERRGMRERTSLGN